MSHHANARLQQRCISPLVLDLLLQFGATEIAPGGIRKMYFDKSARKRIKAYAGPLAGLLEQHLDIYAVVGRDDKLITVAHRIERIKRT